MVKVSEKPKVLRYIVEFSNGQRIEFTHEDIEKAEEILLLKRKMRELALLIDAEGYIFVGAKT